MDMFYALAEPNRRRIIQILAKEGQLTATEISSNFKISPQAISQHLKILLGARLLKMDRNAQQHIYRVDPATVLELEAWVEATKRMWEIRFDRLDEVLNAEKKRRLKK